MTINRTPEVAEYRKELPPRPDRMRKLPLDRGYPVPWFVAWLDENNEEMPRGEGKPDFRILHPDAVRQCVESKRCWLCGDTLGAFKAFVIGPMCAVNRISSEPPSHLDCADYAARACPFLSRPKARRREVTADIEAVEPPGTALLRNPGVALVWVTRRYNLVPAPNGTLFDVGEPTEVRWYAEGRPATREEVLDSINSGLPSLAEIAAKDGPGAERELKRCFDEAMTLIPQPA